MALAGHVHCAVLANQAEQEPAGDEIGLEEEDGEFIGAAWAWKSIDRSDGVFIEQAHGEIGLSENIHCWYRRVLSEIFHYQTRDFL